MLVYAHLWGFSGDGCIDWILSGGSLHAPLQLLLIMGDIFLDICSEALPCAEMAVIDCCYPCLHSWTEGTLMEILN